MAIDAVLFDLDNTLYDREAAFERWADGFIDCDLGIEDPLERRELLVWMSAQDADGYGSKRAVFEQLRLRYPGRIENTIAAIDGMAVAFIDNMCMDSQTISLLDRLDAHRMPFGIVTNGSVRQNLKIERLGLDKRTNCILVSDIFGAAKPDAAIFLAAASQLCVAPGDVLFVGDHPVNDILGAMRAGMRTAWVRRGKRWPHEQLPDMPDYTLDHVGQVGEILWP